MANSPLFFSAEYRSKHVYYILMRSKIGRVSILVTRTGGGGHSGDFNLGTLIGQQVRRVDPRVGLS